MDAEANNLKVRENRLRRAAVRQGLFLSRRRRRDENARDFGMYALFRDGRPVAGVTIDGFYTLGIDTIETILTAGAAEPEPVATQPTPPAAPEETAINRRPRRSLGNRTSRRSR